jgi:hypothetical protein
LKAIAEMCASERFVRSELADAATLQIEPTSTRTVNSERKWLPPMNHGISEFTIKRA